MNCNSILYSISNVHSLVQRVHWSPNNLFDTKKASNVKYRTFQQFYTFTFCLFFHFKNWNEFRKSATFGSETRTDLWYNNAYHKEYRFMKCSFFCWNTGIKDWLILSFCSCVHCWDFSLRTGSKWFGKEQIK